MVSLSFYLSFSLSLSLSLRDIEEENQKSDQPTRLKRGLWDHLTWDIKIRVENCLHLSNYSREIFIIRDLETNHSSHVVCHTFHSAAFQSAPNCYSFDSLIVNEVDDEVILLLAIEQLLYFQCFVLGTNEIASIFN